MNCSRFRFLIQQSFDVSLLPQDARMLKQHMESCDGCAQFYANVDQLIEASPDIAPPDECLPANSESLARRIMEEIAKEKGGGMDFFSQLKSFFSIGKKGQEKKEDSKDSAPEKKKAGLSLPFPHIKRPNEKDQMASSGKNRKLGSEDELMATSARLKSLSRFNVPEAEQPQASGQGLGKKFGMELPNKGASEGAPLSLAETIKRQVAEQHPAAGEAETGFPVDNDGAMFGSTTPSAGGGFGEPNAFTKGGAFGFESPPGQSPSSGFGGEPGEQASPWSVPLGTGSTTGSGWGAPAGSVGGEEASGWGVADEAGTEAGSGWGAPVGSAGGEEASGWGISGEAGTEAESGWGVPVGSAGGEEAGGWGVTGGAATEVGSGWGVPVGSTGGEEFSSWGVTGEAATEAESGWGAPAGSAGGEEAGGWGVSGGAGTEAESGWGAPVGSAGGEEAGGWGVTGGAATEAESGWGAPVGNAGGEEAGGWGVTGGAATEAESGWGAPVGNAGGEEAGGWGVSGGGAAEAESGWGAPVGNAGGEEAGGWGVTGGAATEAESGWGAQPADVESWSEEGEQIQTGVWKTFSLEDTGLGAPQVASEVTNVKPVLSSADFDIPIQERMKAQLPEQANLSGQPGEEADNLSESSGSPLEPSAATPEKSPVNQPVQPNFAPPRNQGVTPGPISSPVPPPARKPGPFPGRPPGAQPPAGPAQHGSAPPGGRPPGGAPVGAPIPGRRPAGNPPPPAAGGVFKKLDDRAIDKVFEQNLGVRDEASTQINAGPGAAPAKGVPAPGAKGNVPVRPPGMPAPGRPPGSPQPSGLGRNSPPTQAPGSPPAPPSAPASTGSGLLKGINEKDIDRIFSENLGVKETGDSQINKGGENVPPVTAGVVPPPVIPGRPGAGARPAGPGPSSPQPPKSAPLPPKQVPSGQPGRPGAVPPPVRPGAVPPSGKTPARPTAAPPPPGRPQPGQPAAKQGGMFNVDDSFMDRIFSENLGIKDNVHTSAPKINLRESVQSIREAAESIPVAPPPKVEGIGRLDAKASTVQDPGSGRISSIGKFLLDQQDLQKLGRLAEDDLSDSQIRVLTLEAADEISRLLEHVGSMDGVVGSVIVGHDGILIANNLPHEFDPESIGIWSLGVYVNTMSVAKKMGHNYLHQLVARSNSGTLIIADFGGGILVCVSEASTTNTLISLMRNITQLVSQ